MTLGWKSTGSFRGLEDSLKKMQKLSALDMLEHYGQAGVDALSAATPYEDGTTASAWSYEVKRDATSWSIIWSNSNMAGPTPVAVLLQMGHGTGTGGWVEGRDFINPALKPILDQMTAEGWKVVTGS